MRDLDLKNKARVYDTQRKAELSQRFKDLVETHGVTAVADVTGLKESSVLVYARHKTTSPVTEYMVVKAETILNQ